jgi:hypothetical protein
VIRLILRNLFARNVCQDWLHKALDVFDYDYFKV